MKTFLKPMEVRWMIVDDNPDILLMMSAILENLTSATIECHDSPHSALAAFQAAPDSYQLVITDFEMPGMNGIELCRQIRALAPAQKVFLATGSGYFTEISAARAGCRPAEQTVSHHHPENGARKNFRPRPDDHGCHPGHGLTLYTQ